MYLYLCKGGWTYHNAHMEVRRQFVGVGEQTLSHHHLGHNNQTKFKSWQQAQ